MNKPDLTIIYYTANVLKESFAEKVRQQILKAADGLPIISISKKPINFGINIPDENPERSTVNIYQAIQKAARLAKTKYIALAEDDVLYPPGHFYTYLPPEDIFAYNMTRWNIYTWSKPPFFSLKFRKILATLIAPTNLWIESLGERFARYPDPARIPEIWMGEPGRISYESELGVTPRKAVDFYTYEPVIVFSHPESLGFLAQGTHKRANVIRALEIPYWGTAERIMNDFYFD